MEKQRRLGALVAGLLVATSAIAAINLNSSKSNVNRLTYQAGLLTEAQAKAMLVELDAMKRPDEAKLKQWLAANFKRFGVEPESVKKIVILPPGNTGTLMTIILLADPTAEAEAVAQTVKGSKSNTSE